MCIVEGHLIAPALRIQSDPQGFGYALFLCKVMSTSAIWIVFMLHFRPEVADVVLVE